MPCSQTLWNATLEEQWMAQYSDGQITLRKLFSTHTKDKLREDFGKSYGIRDSDSLRHLIVLTAVELFTWSRTRLSEN